MSKEDQENVLVQALIETTTKIYNDKKENVENETQNESRKNNSEKQKTKNNLIKILDTFKDCNFDINQKNNGGINPFMVVCLHIPEYIPLFIDYGMDPFVEIDYNPHEKRNQTILEHTKEMNNNNHQILKNTLEQKQLKKESINTEYKTNYRKPNGKRL